MRFRALNHTWRLVATGVAFSALGLGGIFLAVTIIPAATFFVPDRAQRARRAHTIIRTSFRAYVWVLQFLGVIRLQVIGAEKLGACKGAMIVANHPTLLDVVLIMSLVPSAQCVVKHQLWRNPFLRPIVSAAGYIRNDVDPELLIIKCSEALARGENLIIFPEGTRTTPGAAVRFRRGFAHIATLTAADLQLVTITCEPITLVKGQSWYEIPHRAPTFLIVVDKKIEIKPLLQSGPRPLVARRLVSDLETYYHGRLTPG